MESGEIDLELGRRRGRVRGEWKGWRECEGRRSVEGWKNWRSGGEGWRVVFSYVYIYVCACVCMCVYVCVCVYICYW